MSVRGAKYLTGSGTNPDNFTGSSSFTGSSVGSIVTWYGGRSAVIVSGIVGGSNPGLHLRVQNADLQWIPVCSSFVTNQVYPLDLIPGSYRLFNDASSVFGVTAVLCSIPYNL